MKTLLKIRSAAAGLALMAMASARANAQVPIVLGQIPTSLKDAFQFCLGVLFFAGFLWGVIKIWVGADRMSKGDADGKMGIVSGIIIAGAGAIMGALFTIFGLDGGVLEPQF